MTGIVPQEKQIFMSKFALKPGDIVVMSFNHITEDELPWLGKVVEVYSRNPDPGYAIALHSKEDFDTLVGGIHVDVKLSREDTMWAVILFALPGRVEAKVFHTYELEDLFRSNQLMKVENTEDMFAIHHSILLHNVPGDTL